MWDWFAAAGSALSLALFAYAGWLFGRSLQHPHVPLVTQFAQAEQAPAPLPAELLRYTAQLTRLWFYLLLVCTALSALRLGLRLLPLEMPGGPMLALSLLPLALVLTLLLFERRVRLRRFGPTQLSPLRRQWQVAGEVMRRQRKVGSASRSS